LPALALAVPLISRLGKCWCLAFAVLALWAVGGALELSGGPYWDSGCVRCTMSLLVDAY
jgi:hypothetical protein